MVRDLQHKRGLCHSSFTGRQPAKAKGTQMEKNKVENLLDTSAGQIEPAVDMGATILMWSDRAPATVIEVNGNKIKVQPDNWERIDNYGMSDSQSYNYSPNPEAGILEFSKRKNGKWIMVGHPVKGGVSLALGYRRRHYDFSF